MRSQLPRLLVLLLGLPALAGAAPERADAGEPRGEGPTQRAYQGTIRLKPGGDEALRRPIGDRLQGRTRIEVIDWFGGHAVSGQVDVSNPTEETLHLGYHLAFFDAEGGLVGCASQATDVAAGEEVTVGGAVVKLPRSAIERIRSYRIVWYEDTEGIGRR